LKPLQLIYHGVGRCALIWRTFSAHYGFQHLHRAAESLTDYTSMFIVVLR